MQPGSKIAGVAAGLFAATMAALTWDAVSSHGTPCGNARAFQHMAGGLGLGATVCPRWCFVNFDPRIEGCTCAEQPLPGGYCYCPEHNGSVSFFVASEAGRIAAGRNKSPTPRP
jgi:hypothetical protein